MEFGAWPFSVIRSFYCHRASHSIFCKSVTPLQARIENKNIVSQFTASLNILSPITEEDFFGLIEVWIHTFYIFWCFIGWKSVSDIDSASCSTSSLPSYRGTTLHDVMCAVGQIAWVSPIPWWIMATWSIIQCPIIYPNQQGHIHLIQILPLFSTKISSTSQPSASYLCCYILTRWAMVGHKHHVRIPSETMLRWRSLYPNNLIPPSMAWCLQRIPKLCRGERSHHSLLIHQAPSALPIPQPVPFPSRCFVTLELKDLVSKHEDEWPRLALTSYW